jgi:aldehyde:ferredoxin oxidoreductase
MICFEVQYGMFKPNIYFSSVIAREERKMKYTKAKLDHGYANKILTIDLDTFTITAPELEPEVKEYFIGGRSLGLYLLHQAVTSQTRAADP